ncbi:MAG TPA: hypothetical protein VEY06_07405 [Flavisolibacter sp.]|nr:hypothetical protein [Flavisolibacter sp.]
MTIKHLCSALIILLSACNFEQNTDTIKDSTITKDTLTQIEKAPIQVDDNAKQTNQSDLSGVWTDGSSENATLDIRKDSIYYVDQSASYKYSLSNDSIKILYPDWTFTGAVIFNKDTLVIASEDGTTKYWKFKD